jgi:hypothetical protein
MTSLKLYHHILVRRFIVRTNASIAQKAVFFHSLPFSIIQLNNSHSTEAYALNVILYGQ